MKVYPQYYRLLFRGWASFVFYEFNLNIYDGAIS